MLPIKSRMLRLQPSSSWARVRYALANNVFDSSQLTRHHAAHLTTQPPYATPMAKLTHPSPEPTINSLRMLNVVLQKRLAREEESRKQRMCVYR